MDLQRIVKSRLALVAAAILAVAVLATAVGVTLAKRSDGEHQIGAGVTARGAIPDGLRAAVSSPGALPLTSEVMEPVSDFFDIGPSGSLNSAITFRFPLTQSVTADADDYLVMVLSAESLDGPWEALPTTVDPDGTSVHAVADHLSFFVVVRTWLGKVIRGTVDRVKSVLGAAKEVFDGLTADPFANAQQPQCVGEADAEADGYFVEAGNQDAVLWCLGSEGGGYALKVVNNRRYPLLVSHPGLTVIDNGPSFKLRLAQLAKTVSGEGTVVFPNEAATFGVALPESGGTASLQTEIDGVAESLFALEVGIRTALMILTRFGAGPTTEVAGQLSVLELVDRVLQLGDCAEAALEAELNLGRLLAACLGPKGLLDLFGRAAVFLAPLVVVGPVLNFFRSELNALGDQFNGRDRQRIDIYRSNRAAACPTGAENCYGTRHADVDGDGALDTVSLVYDPRHTYGGTFQATVLFANGATARGSFCLPTQYDVWDPGHRTVTVTAAQGQFSFQGFADINDEPGVEIFGRVFVNGSWYISPLTYAYPQLICLSGPSMLRDAFELGLSESIWNVGGTANDTVYGGFRCLRGPGGEPRVLFWRVESVHEGHSDAEYWYTEATYAVDVLPLDLVDSVTVQLSVTSLSQARERALAERAKGSCAGLDELPPL